MRTLGIVTVGRSDYGIYFPILKKIKTDRQLRLCLIVAGMHWSRRHGNTYKEIEADGFKINHPIKTFLDSDDPADIAKSIGLYTIRFAQVFTKQKLDLLVVLGDRFEMFAAASAALPFKIPVVHIHGGELTQGAIDDSLRHSMTKMSHLHFVAAPEYARRVIQLGEEPWRVHVCGAPSLDRLESFEFMKKKEIETRYGIVLRERPFLVTFHPVTLAYEETGKQIATLLDALSCFHQPMIFTMPNVDTHNKIIRKKIRAFSAKHSRVQVVENFGAQAYFSLMALSAVMIGNSSSGMIEAASLKLPVVNVGIRQDGRIRMDNIVDVSCERSEIVSGIRTALSESFGRRLKGLVSPYEQEGGAAEKILTCLKSVPLDQKLLMKRFYNLNNGEGLKTPLSCSCIVLGGGGHARIVLDCLKAVRSVTVYGVLDADPSKFGQTISGAPVLGSDRLLKKIKKKDAKYFVMGLGSTGNNRAREQLFKRALRNGFKPLSVIHPTSIYDPSTKIGAGSHLFPGSIVNARCRIGKSVIINTGVIIEHDCFLGDFSHVATGAKLCGGVRIGRSAFVGAGAVVKQGVSIGARAVVGAGAVVIRNVAPNKVVVGVPARPLKNKMSIRIIPKLDFNRKNELL